MALDQGNVTDSTDKPARRNGIEFAVVRLNSVKNPVRVNHAVPGTVGFKIVGLWIRRRMFFLKGAEIRDLGPAPVGIDSNNTVVGPRQSVLTARARDQSVEGTVDESHIADAAN